MTTKKTEVKVEAKEAKKEYDNEKRIVIFQNNQRTLVNQPIMRGNFVLNGKTYNISLWTKSFIKDGKKEMYLQGQVQEQEQQANESEDLSLFFDESQATAK